MPPIQLTYLVAAARYVAAHVAAIGASAAAVVAVVEGRYADAWQDAMIALAGFGLAVKPSSMVALRRIVRRGGA